MTTDAGETPTAYSLSESYLNGTILQIDADQYATLNEALTIVISAMRIEEIFQVFAKSFLRFEKDLLDVSFEYAYMTDWDFNDNIFFDSIRQRFNVNIITVLTAFQSYDHQCNGILKRATNPPEAQKFNKIKSNEIYDAHLSYRICASLRNYAQHRALPLGGFSIGSKANFDRDKAGKITILDSGFNVSPWLNVTKLAGSSQCKAQLRAELEALGYEKIDIRWLIRSFAGAMYERHAALREFLKPRIISSGKKITDGYDLASAAKNSEAKFLELHGNGEKLPMRKDLSANVLKSFETHKTLARALSSYVTSQITPEAATYSGQTDA